MYRLQRPLEKLLRMMITGLSKLSGSRVMYKSINSLLIENLHLPCCCMFTQGLLRTFWNSPALCISVTIMGIDLTSVYSRMKELTLTKIFILGQEYVTFCSKGPVIESDLNTNSLVTLRLNFYIVQSRLAGVI